MEREKEIQRSSCLALDGERTVKIAGITRTLGVSGFEACKGSCPKAGGSIEYYGGVLNVTITVTFDGSDLAHCSSSNGREGTLQLFCG